MIKFAIRSSQSAVLVGASRWLLLAALVYAPWDYGGVTEPAIVRLNWILAAALVFWAVGKTRNAERGMRKANGRRARESELRNSQSAIRDLPLALLLAIALLLALGWWMVLNAKAIYDSERFIFVAIANWLPSAVGSVDQAVSGASMVRVTVMLGTILLVADLVRDPRWLLRLWWTLGLMGSSIALLGLIQKATGAPMIFWQPTRHAIGTFFATFYYHGNAGAFLNLTLPLTIGLAWRAFTRPGRPWTRALWLTLSVISVVAVFANTSRMSQALAGGILLVLAIGSLPKAWGVMRRRLDWSTAVVGALALGLALFAVVQTSRLDRSLQRWEQISETLPRDARWNAAKAAWSAAPEAGWSGFGPGTFAIVFPYYTAGQGENLRGRWIFLHQDYLQTLMEWGWLGSGLLGWVFFGGMAVAGWRLRKAKCEMRKGQSAIRNPRSEIVQWRPRQRLFLTLVLLGLTSAALHALVDFPLQVASIQLYVATYVGVCWGVRGANE